MHDMTLNTSYYLLTGDTSQYQDRFNSFTLTSSESNIAAGFYTYKVFEQTGTTLNPVQATSIVEIGKVRVIEAVTGATTYNYTASTTVYYNS
jgi:hypothetical protein